MSLAAPKAVMPLHAGKSGEERGAEESVAPIRLVAPLPAREDWPEGTCLALVPSFEEARRLLGPCDAVQRAERSARFWRSPQIRARSRLRLGMHDRAEEYIVGEGELCREDSEGHRRHLPLHLKTVHLDRLTLGRGEVLDLSARADCWPGLHHREELYLWVRIGELRLSRASSIVVRGNVCSVEFGSVRFTGGNGASSSWPEIAILGTPHPPFSSIRRSDALAGKAGLAGTAGRDGAPVAVRQSVFGPSPDHGASAGDGARGEDGGNGGDGDHGRNGGMQMLADIRIGALEGFGAAKLRIRGRAGDGAPGADGGAGGHGGPGGSGGDGFAGARVHLPAGKGGVGGDGGAGGGGGHGGHGGLSSNIFITAPERDARAIVLVSEPGAGGAGGAGGPGGRGGPGGPGGASSGAGLDRSACGAPGGDGQDGPAGAQGCSGRAREGPPMWLIPIADDRLPEARALASKPQGDS